MVNGLRKNGKTTHNITLILDAERSIEGKQWHETKKAFRPMAGLTSYKQRIEQQKRIAATKLVEKDMKEEKESKRQVQLNSVHVSNNEAYHTMQYRIQTIKERREAREEKIRHEKLAQRMHAKKVERLKKREKRNKMLKS